MRQDPAALRPAHPAMGFAVVRSSFDTGDPRNLTARRAEVAPMSQTARSLESLTWTPTSWQQRVALQQPQYEDAVELNQAIDELSQLPPLVTSWEVLALKQALAEA